MVRKEYSRGYTDKPPDVTDTGIGKNYNGHRIFHSKRTGAIEYILYDGSTREADPPDIETFKRDLTEAARKGDKKVERYLGDFRNLVAEPAISELEPFKPGPEGITPAVDALIKGNRVVPEPGSTVQSDKPN